MPTQNIALNGKYTLTAATGTLTAGTLTLTVPVAGTVVYAAHAPTATTTSSATWDLTGIAAGTYNATVTALSASGAAGVTLTESVKIGAIQNLETPNFGPAYFNIDSPRSTALAGSGETVFVQFTVVSPSTGVPISPITQSVSLAFTTGADPHSSDYLPAQWITRTDGTYWGYVTLPATLAPGTYSVFGNIAGITGKAGKISVLVSKAYYNGYAPLPPHLVGIGTWRSRLARSVADVPQALGYDAVTGFPIGGTIPGVFNSSDFDDAFKAAASLLSEYTPKLRPLPALSILPTQGTYALPADFREPDADTWTCLLGPSAYATGHMPGSRYAYQRYQDMANSPLSASWGRGSRMAYGYFGGGIAGLGMDMLGLGNFGYDAQGNILEGGGQRQGITFYNADFDHSTPYMNVYPLPLQTQGPYTQLLYKSGVTVYRLTPFAVNAVNTGWQASDGTLWVVDAGQTLKLTSVPTGDTFDPNTDILSITESGDDLEQVRLSLLYAKYYLLSEVVLASANRGDSVTYAFYSQATGKSRTDIANEAREALKQFQARTSRRARSSMG